MHARETIIKAIFVDLGESFDDRDFSAGEALEYLEPKVRRDSGPAHPISVRAAHGPRGPANSHLGPPGQPLRGDPHATLHLLSLEDFTKLLNGYAPDALVWNSAHKTIGLANDERVARRRAGSAV